MSVSIRCSVWILLVASQRRDFPLVGKTPRLHVRFALQRPFTIVATGGMAVGFFELVLSAASLIRKPRKVGVYAKTPA